MSDNSQSIKIDRLLENLPVKLNGDGGHRVLDLLRKKLVSTIESDQIILPQSFWQEIFDQLIKPDGRLLSYATRQRYRRLLEEVGQDWFSAGLITEEHLPVLKVPPRHQRRQVVRIDRLRDRHSGRIYHLEHFERLAQFFCSKLDGKADYLRQLDDQELEQHIFLACLLSGFVQEDPLQVLYKLRRQDIPLEPDLPVWMPQVERRRKKR